eukprot:maker-scaffold_43-snap-gene-1.33-mRNA-1 protein AED:0.00 eAED:0.00 QI:61/1/1/1/1/1/2/21/387
MKKIEEQLFTFEQAEQTYALWNWLQCISLTQLLLFIALNWRSIEFYKFRMRLAVNFLLTTFSSVVGTFESIIYGKEIKKQELHLSPVFILGHWRSGTTLLHNLFSLDEKNFSCPTTFQCTSSTTFLLMDRVKSLVENRIEPKRAQDNMPLGVDLPQEDEYGLVGHSTTSPYFATILPSEFTKYKKYFYLENLTKEKETWVNMFKHFLKKITYQNVKKNKANRLVLKSPLHTARVHVLNEVFPDAKYIYIVRNPYDVFKSTVNLYNKLFAHSFLETPAANDILELILTQYEIMLNKYLKAKDDGILVEGENLMEIRYEDLTKNISGKVKEIYDVLNIPSWESIKRKVEDEERNLRGYKKNKFNALDPELRELVYKRWKVAFDAFGYKK